VAEDVNRKWLSAQAARDTYGVSVRQQANGIDVEIDWKETRRLRV
jgi:hypothetical protein